MRCILIPSIPSYQCCQWCWMEMIALRVGHSIPHCVLVQEFVDLSKQEVCCRMSKRLVAKMRCEKRSTVVRMAYGFPRNLK